MSELHFSIRNLNLHEEFRLETRPGLNRLTGGPGTGKSTILSAFQLAAQLAEDRASTNEPWKLHLEVRNGAKGNGRKQAVGQLRMPGLGGEEAGYDLKASGTVVALKPLPRVHFLPGESFAQLTRSTRVQPETAAKEELQAFSDLTQIRCEVSDLVSDDLASLIPALEGPLPIVAEHCRLKLHDKALVVASEAALQARAADALSAGVSGRDFGDVGTVDIESSARESVEREVSELRIARRGREAQEALQVQFRLSHPVSRPTVDQTMEELEGARGRLEEALTAIGEGPGMEPDLVSAGQNFILMERNHSQAQRKTATMAAIVADLEKQLEAAKSSWALASTEEATHRQTLEAASQRLEATRQAHGGWRERAARYDEQRAGIVALQRNVSQLETEKRRLEEQGRQWDERQALLERPIAGPSLEDVQQAAKRLEAAWERMALARQREDDQRKRLEAEMARTAAETLAAQEDRLRKAATSGLQERIAARLQSEGIDGWSIQEGRLFCRDERTGSMVSLRSLSDSLRDSAVLRLMMARAKVPPDRTPVLALPSQSVLEGMTSDQQQALADFARAHGVHILGAVHADSREDIRCEYL